MFNIRDFGACGDGIHLDTQAIQQAIDTCALRGGGTLLFPFGTYLTGSVQMKSHVHMVLEAGACLLGSKDLDADFDPDEPVPYPLYQDVSHSYFHHSLIWGEQLEDISFSGKGCIDMQSAWEKDDTRWAMRRGAKIFALKECCRVTIAELTLRNATDLAVYLAGCETVRITDITADVHIDGISPDACRDVVISGCIIRSGDDAIVPKSSYTLGRSQLCENVVITNCVISSRCNAIKLGTESNGGFRNFSINNCTIYNTRFAGLALEIADGGVLEGIAVSNLTMRNVGTPFFIILSDRRRGPEGTGMGTVRDISIDNVVVTGPYESWTAIRENIQCTRSQQDPACVTSTITGQPGYPVMNVSFSNIRMVLQGGGTREDAQKPVPDDPKSYPESTRFGLMLPSYAFYCRHVEGITFHNVAARCIERDERPAFAFDDARKIRLFNTECEVTPEGVPMAMFMENTLDIKVH